jgi:hypothetical protein
MMNPSPIIWHRPFLHITAWRLDYSLIGAFSHQPNSSFLSKEGLFSLLNEPGYTTVTFLVFALPLRMRAWRVQMCNAKVMRNVNKSDAKCKYIQGRTPKIVLSIFEFPVLALNFWVIPTEREIKRKFDPCVCRNSNINLQTTIR